MTLRNLLIILTVLNIFFNCCYSNIIPQGNALEEVIQAGPNLINGFLSPTIVSESIQAAIANVLRSGPNLKEAISKLEETDFLKEYKLGEKNEDLKLNITELVQKYGYKIEQYRIQTEDGYIISAFRIPSKGEPVLIVHGIINSAADWLTAGRDVALPYLLADLGYDVWLLNCRGAVESSRGHVSLSPEKNPKQYWDFSWDEIGRYDLPATIDFVLHKTGKEKLRYVGHSQGTTVFFVMASERPMYNEKVSLMVALSPIAWVSHMFTPIFRILTVFSGSFSNIIRKIIGSNAFEADNPLVRFVTRDICGNTETATLICGNLLFSLGGFDYPQVNATQMPLIFKHTPSSISSKLFMHFSQVMNNEGKFCKYDYGAEKNLKKYGTEKAPEYPVHKITAPVAIFYKNITDWFSVYEDVLALKNKLPNVVEFYEIPYETWSHTDYTYAKDARDLVYYKVVEQLKN